MKSIVEMPINAMTIEIVRNLYTVFNNDEKVANWLKAKNYIMGNVSPLQLIYLGRGEKVLEFTRGAARDALEPEART